MASPATETFLQEATEGLERLEQCLLTLEDAPSDSLVDEVFRTLHTIKGSGAMFGYEALASFTHVFENAFELVRDGKLGLDRTLIDTSLAARDHMAQLLANNDDPDRLAELTSSPEATALVEKIEALQGAPTKSQPAESREAESNAPKGSREVRIAFTPNTDALRFGMRPDLLLAELAELGEMEVEVDTSAVPPLEDLDPQASYLSWTVSLESANSLDTIRDVFIFANDAQLSITEQQIGSQYEQADQTVRAAEDHSPGRERASTPEVGGPPPKNDAVRVPAARLDDLMDQLGELVIAQTRLDRIAGELADGALTSVSEEIDRLVTGLRDSALAMRMLPIEIVFGKFRRVVRTLSGELGKDVTLVTEGGDTELDKNVIDSLTEPLVHMIRNAIDHGIEPAEERRAAGKSPRATVRLVARQSGGEVLISVGDDGGGLDTEAIRERAISRGMIGADETPDEAALHRLIFEPAFSTVQTISNVSGRGVGMDAVRRVVNDLRGSIEIETEPGAGTTITLRLPVTLAIIDGLLVRVGRGVYVLPLSVVSECVELASIDYARDSGRTLMQIRDELVPFLKLDAVFGAERTQDAGWRVVVVSCEGRRIGLVVDDVLGQHQTVIKTFSIFHRGIDGFAGSTILGDGRVALIIDAPALVKSVHDHRQPDAPAIAAAH